LGQRLLTDDADAGYVILAYYPQQRVFIDDRYDMYPRSVIDAFFGLSNGSPGWAHALDPYKVNLVVVDRQKALAHDLSQDPRGPPRRTPAGTARTAPTAT